jgi:hypothetical protein
MARLASKCFVCAAFVVALTAPARAQSLPTRRCGSDRWPVKTLNDRDRNRVNFRPIDVTVAALGTIHVHEIPYPKDRRIQPEELKVYRVRAKLIEVRREGDSDLHLILADLDRPNMRMIAEIPTPGCAEGSGHETDYQRARLALSTISAGSIVEIIGVGFFDFLHDAKGGAMNGIELHPVLRVGAVREPSSQAQGGKVTVTVR